MLENHADEYYWLGFIYADGNICDYNVKGMNKARRTFSLHVAYKDKEHLSRLANILSLNMYERQKTGACLISTCRKSIVDYLSIKGIIPRKSLSNDVSCLIGNIPLTERWNFFRGYFDGDGCISNFVANHKKGAWNASRVIIVGSEAFISYLSDFLKEQGIRNHVGVQRGLYRCSVGNKKDLLEFRRLMYANDGVCLERKRRKFDEIKIINQVEFKRHIYFKKRDGKWVAFAEKESKKYLGSFPTREEAVSAFNDYVSINT